MVWFPCLYSWLRPLTFLISCSCLWSPVISPPIPLSHPLNFSFSDMEGKYGCRYERVEWKHLSDTFHSILHDIYLGGWQGCCSLRGHECGRPQWVPWTLLGEGSHRKCVDDPCQVQHCYGWDVAGGSECVQVGPECVFCVNVCSIWTVSIMRAVCHAYSPS